MDLPAESTVLVYGGTAPGIVIAVRAAREGLNVTLVTPSSYLGGALPSLGAVESHYRGVRSPLLQEFIDRVTEHYRGDSAQYHACAGGKMIAFEPHVAEGILRDWVTREPRIRWCPGFIPRAVERTGRHLRSVLFEPVTAGAAPWQTSADTFVEASDEGDLMALSGTQFRIGREARWEFGEPSAGKVFTRWLNGEHPRAAIEGRLNLVTARATTSEPLAGSTGESDDNIQSYSYRLCLTDEPANRRMLESPPAGYDRARFAPILLPVAEKECLALPFHHRFLVNSLEDMVAGDHIFHGHALPNRKRSWNATNLTGASKHYPSANDAERLLIECQHRDHALGLMWFLQNDPAMPANIRTLARAWGLARDEFTETDNFPPQLYVREARRLVGREVFTERDALIRFDEERAPVHEDAIAITEFSLDSLACTTERLPGKGALCDGQLFQMEVSRPGQIPYRALLPRDIDNLLVITTLSATHVGWGTVRQTPTLMHVAESAAWAAVLAARHGVTASQVDVSELQRQLVSQGVMISFFNDFDMSHRGAWVPAIQFLGAKGFFPSYDARPYEPLDPQTVQRWSQLSGQVIASPKLRSEACAEIFATHATESQA